MKSLQTLMGFLSLTAEPLTGTMRAHQREGFRTAKDIAVQRSHDALIALLEPEIYHDIAAHALKKMETRVHEFMREMAGNAVSVPMKACSKGSHDSCR